MIKKLKVVRHGNGVQIFGSTNNETGFVYKYEGEWVKDKKQGKGIFYFSDKSIYEGNFFEDTFHGFGKFTFPMLDVYIGDWILGKMEGEGEFKHHDGHVLKGLFKNNYYLDKDKFVDPFLSSEDLATFQVKNKEFVSKFKFDSEKFSRNDIFIVKNPNDMNSAIDTIFQNNKIPVIIRSRDNIRLRNDILSFLKNPNYKEIDLRHYFLRVREKIANKPIFAEIQKIVVECASKGLNLVLNFDECAVKYEELFDPDIKEFYGPGLLSSKIFHPKEFGSAKSIQDHFKDTPNFSFDKNFRFLIYSKFVVDLSQSAVDLTCYLEKRFEKALPLKRVCFVVLSK